MANRSAALRAGIVFGVCAVRVKQLRCDPSPLTVAGQRRSCTERPFSRPAMGDLKAIIPQPFEHSRMCFPGWACAVKNGAVGRELVK